MGSGQLDVMNDEQRRYQAKEWLDPRIEVRASSVDGRALVAYAPIEAGETVVVWGGDVFAEADVRAGAADAESLVPIGEGIYLGTAAGAYNREADDRGDFMNHSCDPNCWLQDERTLIARRHIEAGEEVSADYAFWKGDDSPVSRFQCRCGSPLCRGGVTGRDWRLPELQERYRGQFSSYINERIAKLHS